MTNRKGTPNAFVFPDDAHGEGTQGQAQSSMEWERTLRESVKTHNLWVRAREFVELNRSGAWREWLAIADKCIETGTPFSNQLVVELVRSHDWLDALGNPVRISHSWRAALVRILIIERPALRPLVTLRESRFDGIFEGIMEQRAENDKGDDA